MGLIKMETAAVREIRNNIRNLNQEQFDRFQDLLGYIDNINGAWDGDMPEEAKTRLARVRADSGKITDMLNRYGAALEFAIQELEEADWRASLGTRIANVGGYPAGTSRIGECVWYVRNRAAEKNLDTYGILGNGNQWWDAAKDNGAPRGTEIRDNSIACFSGPYAAGHVVFIEKVINGRAYYTEANVDGGIRDGRISPGDGVLKSRSLAEFEKLYNESLQGYIYL